MSDEPKYCVNCVHFNCATPGYCMNKNVAMPREPTLVWGKRPPVPVPAEEARLVTGKCGPDGLLFVFGGKVQ